MYYLPNVEPGNYTLKVNDKLDFSVQVNDQAFQDISPILFTSSE